MKKTNSLAERHVHQTRYNEAGDAFLGRAAFVNSKIVKDCLAAAAVVEATGEGARALARWPEAGEARKERKEGRKKKE